jgi:hypothetical protein
MKLMTQEVIKNLPDLYAQEKVKDPIVHLKFFLVGTAWTWYITEGRKEVDEETGEEDWRFFGKVVNNIVPEGEWGYTMLSQLKEVRGAFGLPVERDKFWSAKPASQCN